MKLAVIALALLPAVAQAQVYKCVASDGSTSYSAVPCPTDSGESTRIIEPVPPSGPLNIPATEQPAEDTSSTDAQPSADGKQPSAPSVTGITVIEDSEAQRREEKRTQMREDELQHKKDLYDADLERQEQFYKNLYKPPR